VDAGKGMVAIDERQVDDAALPLVVAGKELLTRALEVLHDALDPEPGEVCPHVFGVAPEVHAADGPPRTVLEQRVRGIDEAQEPGLVVPEPERETHDAETVPRPDHDHVTGPERADETVVHESESEVQVLGALAVPQRLGLGENVLQEGGLEAEGCRAGPA